MTQSSRSIEKSEATTPPMSPRRTLEESSSQQGIADSDTLSSSSSTSLLSRRVLQVPDQSASTGQSPLEKLWDELYKACSSRSIEKSEAITPPMSPRRTLEESSSQQGVADSDTLSSGSSSTSFLSRRIQQRSNTQYFLDESWDELYKTHHTTPSRVTVNPPIQEEPTQFQFDWLWREMILDRFEVLLYPRTRKQLQESLTRHIVSIGALNQIRQEKLIQQTYHSCRPVLPAKEPQRTLIDTLYNRSIFEKLQTHILAELYTIKDLTHPWSIPRAIEHTLVDITQTVSRDFNLQLESSSSSSNSTSTPSVQDSASLRMLQRYALLAAAQSLYESIPSDLLKLIQHPEGISQKELRNAERLLQSILSVFELTTPPQIIIDAQRKIDIQLNVKGMILRGSFTDIMKSQWAYNMAQSGDIEGCCALICYIQDPRLPQIVANQCKAPIQTTARFTPLYEILQRYVTNNEHRARIQRLLQLEPIKKYPNIQFLTEMDHIILIASQSWHIHTHLRYFNCRDLPIIPESLSNGHGYFHPTIPPWNWGDLYDQLDWGQTTDHRIKKTETKPNSQTSSRKPKLP